VKLFNAGLTGLFDLIFWPFSSPLWALTVFSIVCGIAMLWLFGKVSNQEAIGTVRDRIRGDLIAIRLFGDDLRLMLKLQARFLYDNAVFLKYAFVPILVMIVPFVFILTQLNLRYGAGPLATGQSALVKLKLADVSAIDGDISLETPAGVSVETEGVRVAQLREVAWRIRAAEPGDYDLLVNVGGEQVQKKLRVGDAWGSVSTLRSGNFLDLLFYPGEAPIRSETVESIEITHPTLDLDLFGWSVNWLVFFIVLSIVTGFAFRRVLGVEI